jgi:hypothetical protein
LIVLILFDGNRLSIKQTPFPLESFTQLSGEAEGVQRALAVQSVFFRAGLPSGGSWANSSG